jgi:DNA-directed RNA polymerase subunit RPC12/RpoP
MSAMPNRLDADTPGKVEVACPYCASRDTEFFSLFGQQLLTVQYYCNACHTPFEYVKDDDMLDAYATRKENKE